MRVLIVEDEPQLLRAVADGLLAIGCVVDRAHDGLSGLHQALHVEYDAIVLDLMLPGLSGEALLRALRKTRATPVLVLTARDAVDDKVNCLNTGADDYLTKPFAIRELQARVRALVRRGVGHPSPVLTIGSVAIDTASRTVQKEGAVIDLTPMEYSLLELLAHRRGSLVTRTTIYEHLWNDDSDTLSNVVYVYVSTLRNKLGHDLITTRRGHGYLIQ
jgi:two-component system OmpR family response regulator